MFSRVCDLSVGGLFSPPESPGWAKKHKLDFSFVKDIRVEGPSCTI